MSRQLSPVMSHDEPTESVLDSDIQTYQSSLNAEAGPSRPRQIARASAKSISSSRPPLSLNIRNPSYTGPSLSPRGDQRSPISPVHGDAGQTKNRIGLKRRVSTPLVSHLQLVDEDQPSLTSGEMSQSGTTDQMLGAQQTPPRAASATETRSRGRSTSTSIVVPSLLLEKETAPTISVQPPTAISRPPTARPPKLEISLPKPSLTLTSPSPDDEDVPHLSSPKHSDQPTSFLDRVYNTAESAIGRLTVLVRPVVKAEKYAALYRRGSDDESEKGLARDGDDTTASIASTSTRSSTDSSSVASSSRQGGRYWGLWASEDSQHRLPLAGAAGDDGYFSLPPTPPEQDDPSAPRRPSYEFEEALLQVNGKIAALPTPALSAHSLSGARGGQSRSRQEDGWLRGVLAGWVGGARQGKTGQVIRDLGWTVGVLITGFFVSLGMALWLLKGLPITTLRHLPKSTTDVQLLSAEIRAYMASSDVGWWHTVGVLTFVGCWKHAWSVPGAIVLNILVGSLLSPFPALIMLTIITATGSLGSYLLSRPLAPLIAVLFPKPLSLVRAALAPSSASSPAGFNPSDGVTPIHLSSDPAAAPVGSGSGEKPNVWRRLLIMRAMGFVPWSGMNVACGVVGVDWKTFWLTTAAGSASWSYTTASIGDLLARLAVPSTSASLDNASIGATATATAMGDMAAQMQGESLTGMLRDPVLIAKMVFLTALTLVPVFLKRSSAAAKAKDAPTSDTAIMQSIVNEKVSFESRDSSADFTGSRQSTPSSPRSPLSLSLARFTPTPAVFDVLSFGRTALRTAVGVLGTGGRQVGAAMSRMAGK